MTWVPGPHAIKGGLQLARMGFDVFRPEYPSGQYLFGPAFTQGPNPQQASGTAGFGLATFLLGGRDGASRYQTDPDRDNIAPRVGFAWRFEQKMVLRGGYGIVYYPGSGG